MQELQSFTKGPALVDLRLVIAKIKKLSSPLTARISRLCLHHESSPSMEPQLLYAAGDLTMTATNAVATLARLCLLDLSQPEAHADAS